MSKKNVIIGASASGISAARWLAKLVPNDEIILISAEEKSYNKCLLVDYLADYISEDKLLLPIPTGPHVFYYGSMYVNLIDPVKQMVTCSNGLIHSYDNLILAMGSSAWIPPMPALREAQNCMTFHTLSDVQALKEFLKSNKKPHIAVIGAGLTGIECADALIKIGAKVSIIDRAEHVLPWLLTQDEAQFLQERMSENEVSFLLNSDITEIQMNDQVVSSIMLSDNTKITPDLVVVTTGVRQNSCLVEGLELQKSENGIIVDEYMRTSDERIWAVGDLVEIYDPVVGKNRSSALWADAMLQGMIAAHAIAGKPKKYPYPHHIVQTHVFGLDIAVCGERNRPVVFQEKESEQCLISLSEDNKLKAFSYIGTDQLLKIKLIHGIKTGSTFET